jgi:glycosyltransferase involved in cell wall biosynthesis
MRSVALLRRFVRAHQIDLLHSHHRFTTIIARAVRAITGVPLLATVHEFKHDGRLTAGLWARNITIVPSQALKAHLVSFYRAPSSQIAVIPHAIEPQPAIPESAAWECPHGAGGPLVGFIGRLAPEKGARFFIESIPQVARGFPSARFLIVGDGPEAPQLRALALRLGLGAESLFAGSSDDAAGLLVRVGVVVIPSLSESFSLVALEAMRAGRPVVSSAVGGLPEIVRAGETGLLVPPGSASDLAVAVGELLADPERRHRMGARARQLFLAEHDPAAMIARTLQMYQAARSAGGAGRGYGED